MPRKYYNPEVAKSYRIRKRERIKAYHQKYMEGYRLRPYVRKYYHDYYVKNGAVIRQRACDISREKLYGVTASEYRKLWDKQKGLCYICGKPKKGKKSLGVDHNHATAEIRVLLCQGCNWLAGRIERIGWNNVKNYGDRFLNGN